MELKKLFKMALPQAVAFIVLTILFLLFCILISNELVKGMTANEARNFSEGAVVICIFISIFISSIIVASYSGYRGIKNGLSVIESGFMSACSWFMVAVLLILAIAIFLLQGIPFLNSNTYATELPVITVAITGVIILMIIYSIIAGVFFFVLGCISALITKKFLKK